MLNVLALVLAVLALVFQLGGLGGTIAFVLLAAAVIALCLGGFGGWSLPTLRRP